MCSFRSSSIAASIIKAAGGADIRAGIAVENTLAYNYRCASSGLLAGGFAQGAPGDIDQGALDDG
jgi:hypothetical protein